MAYFEWASDMEVDQGVIDEEHKRLVAQVNTLHTATSEGRGQEIVGELLKELIADTVEHIRDEERILESLNFPDLEQHKKGHQRFIDDLRGLQTKYDAGSITVAAQLSSVLRDWLSLHIRRSDKSLVHFLRQKEREAKASAKANRQPASPTPTGVASAGSPPRLMHKP